MLREFKKQRFHDEAEYRAALERYGLTEEELKAHLKWQVAALRFTEQRFQAAGLPPATGAEPQPQDGNAERAAPDPGTAPEASRATSTANRAGAAGQCGPADGSLVAPGARPHARGVHEGGFRMTRGRKIALIVLGGLAALVLVVIVGGIIVVQTPWFRGFVRDQIVQSVEDATGGRTEVGAFSFDWKHLRAQVRDFVIHGTEPPGSAPLFRARLLQVDLQAADRLEEGGGHRRAARGYAAGEPHRFSGRHHQRALA